MHLNSDRYALPDVMSRSDGETRVVGFELEFSGVDLDQAAAALEASLGAQLRSSSSAERSLHVDSLGEFTVELDWDYLKRRAAEEGQATHDSEWNEKLGHIAALLVPVEVVCPPIPLDRLDALDPMVTALRNAGALGTEESLTAAYGVHVNTEIPALDAETLFSYIRAFSLLQWWLVDAHEVDLTRRLSPYIDLYPESYLKTVLARSSATMDDIFDDYLEHNDTRNRALDLLPLLAEIDEARVRSVVDDPKIKSRPAFHYRLPNCRIEQADWSLAHSWNRWCVLERLAGRKEDMDALSAAFLEMDRPVLGVSRADWRDYMDRWLNDHELV